MKTREQRVTDTIVGVLAIVAVSVCLFGALVLGTNRLPDEDPKSTTTSTTVQPQEDEPGWDCRVHGNKICG